MSEAAEQGTTSINITIENLDPQQQLAVERGLDTKRRIVAITGPAGSGKTTILRFINEALEDAGYVGAIAAPTGKAARRIREATGQPAQTLHALLKYTAPTEIDPKTGKPFGATFPRVDRQNPLEVDYVIVDEYAMVTQELHRNLIDAFKAGCRLIVFGDISQLPPIESVAAIAAKPTAFQDLLTRFEGVTLERVHRQVGDSGILYNAQRVLKGAAPQNRPDFKMLVTEKPIDNLIEQLEFADYTSLRNQIITPGNKSWIGTHNLNAMLQAALMPPGRFTMKVPRRSYNGKVFDPTIHVGVGDKVAMTKNWYDLECSNGTFGVFNGEVGTVIEISELDEIVVDFEDRICRIPPAVQVEWNNRVMVAYPQNDLYLAYAVTTHKAQGSEYDNVIYVLNKSLIAMMNRKNLYTAITRAREKVTLITDARSLSMSILVKEPKVFDR